MRNLQAFRGIQKDKELHIPSSSPRDLFFDPPSEPSWAILLVCCSAVPRVERKEEPRARQ
jgi:hypothetical protein